MAWRARGAGVGQIFSRSGIFAPVNGHALGEGGGVGGAGLARREEPATLSGGASAEVARKIEWRDGGVSCGDRGVIPRCRRATP